MAMLRRASWHLADRGAPAVIWGHDDRHDAAGRDTGDPNNRSLGTLWKPWDPAPGGSKRLVFDADDTRANVSMSNADAP